MKTYPTKVEVAWASARVSRVMTFTHGRKPMLQGHLSDTSIHRFPLRIFAAYLLLAPILESVVWGQIPVTTPAKNSEVSSRTNDPLKRTGPKTTFVEFELLQGPDGGGLQAQQWLKILEPLDVSLRVHRPILSDKPELRERTAGNLRYVTAVGTLDRSGKIIFPDRTFDVGDVVKLKEWIDELRTFGMRGNPTDQPLWGLTKDQFASFYDGLTTPINFETEGLTIVTLVGKVPFSKQIPLHWTADALERLSARGNPEKTREELKGFSTGLVLAVALGGNGLGFRPNRTPNGEIEILIEPRNSKHEQWPVGWPVQRQTSKAVPKLFAMVPIELSDVELSDVLLAISKLSDVPILIDAAELESKQIDLEKIKVSFPKKITTWGIAINRLVVPHKLTREIWQDEAGRVFVWITTAQAARVKE